MPPVLSIILALGFAAAVVGAVRFWRLSLEAERREDLRALAARRGWSVTMTGDRLGRAGTLRFAPRGGHPWTAEARPGADSAPTTIFEAAEPRWAGGTLVLQLGKPSAEDAGEPRPLVALLGEDVARLAAPLRRLSSVPGLLALADADPSHRVDLASLSRALTDWPPIVAGERGLPVVMLSADGFRLRLRHPVRRADQWERFLDLALDLSRLIGP